MSPLPCTSYGIAPPSSEMGRSTFPLYIVTSLLVVVFNWHKLHPMIHHGMCLLTSEAACPRQNLTWPNHAVHAHWLCCMTTSGDSDCVIVSNLLKINTLSLMSIPISFYLRIHVRVDNYVPCRTKFNFCVFICCCFALVLS